jgi:hypothetical protein
MDQDLGFGGPVVHKPPATARPDVAPPPVPPASRSVAPLVLVVIVLVVAAAVVGFLWLMNSGGKEAATAASTALDQVDASADADAQSTLRNALAAAKVGFTDSGSYADVTPDVLAQIEPSYTYTTTASNDPHTISVASTEGAIGLAVRSDSGTCFWVRDDVTSGAGTSFATGGACTGAAALAAA